ncbi:MAG: hypothetical protein JXB49_33920 [Bacteroidales bacterium]|nr:hypothetical protein [Bacteroidales bacterium]
MDSMELNVPDSNPIDDSTVNNPEQHQDMGLASENIQPQLETPTPNPLNDIGISSIDPNSLNIGSEACPD